MSFLPFTFSIVGVQKAGTSTLQWMLNQHPEVARPPRKEMGWFDVDDATGATPTTRRTASGTRSRSTSPPGRRDAALPADARVAGADARAAPPTCA
ncbi:sulfotransferase [Nocardioides sp. B-3]|uniref:sulfotransferase n=1 Tax=Nocardioides sp. B-3 TaxID=2895565 RepID=UPI002152A2E2|nr:sulfotransferase [Nocardioides sp. B-3]UUZ58867.1 sulfotransferase [Nocardioides sp. B-3]